MTASIPFLFVLDAMQKNEEIKKQKKLQSNEYKTEML